jgi:WD40 repeat protein
MHCLTAGADQAITAWKVGTDWQPSVAFRCVGHTSSVDALDISPDSRYFVSGSFDGTAKIWTCSPDDLETTDADVEGSARSNKRRKGEQARVIPAKHALRTLEGHTAVVNCVCFDRGSESSRSVVTGSSDHSIRQWDMETGYAVRTMVCCFFLVIVYSTAHSVLPIDNGQGRQRDRRLPVSGVDSVRTF